MSEPDVARSMVNLHFSQIAASYKNKNIKELISHYTEDIDLLFWNDIGRPITNRQELALWYEELFSQNDVVSISFQINQVYRCEDVLATASQWKITLKRPDDDSPLEELSLRTTHIFKRQNSNHWLICHLHASPVPSVST
ncbi:YybH family protein [Endozoicomonas atrinae]|uniref:YybH family protein n=1 Tax=Endozoicomonas atrinae TaxID=1333660 RepID=UPI00082542D7|nr:nuclear transport factor 2 family protein [Endozoicomonas atrinae]